MAAGLGFKDFTTGEVLTAADVDGYLMQGIWVFASTAARDASVTSPSEGNFAFTKDTNSLWYYDGAAWVASGATGDIEGVTAGIGISGGGTSGTVTVTNSMATAIDAKGDLVVGTGADTFSKLTVGANNTVLTADSAEATGLKWAAAASGGGMTLLSTTTLSGASTTASSISGSYKNLYILIVGVNNASDSVLRLNPNSDATLVDSGFVTAIKDVSVTASANWSDVFMISGDQANKAGNTNNIFTCEIFDYANASQHKLGNYSCGLVRSTGDKAVQTFGNGRIKTTSAITAIQITSGTGNFSGGTMFVYGVS
jgi:hypothetical protein